MIPLFNYYLSISLPVPTSGSESGPRGDKTARSMRIRIYVSQNQYCGSAAQFCYPDPPLHFEMRIRVWIRIRTVQFDRDPDPLIKVKQSVTTGKLTLHGYRCFEQATTVSVYGSIFSLLSYWILILMRTRIRSAFWLWCGSGFSSGFPKKWCRILPIYADPYRTYPQHWPKQCRSIHAEPDLKN